MADEVTDPTEQTGTGTPRSAETGPPAMGTPSGEDLDPAVVTGATASSQPALADDVTPNRSGSGGSGGAVDGGEAGTEEGTGSQSMDEMLGQGGPGSAPER